MEIHALKAFVEVAIQASFSRAAERLFLSQPAISKRIAGLEQELDTRLLDRVGRKVRLTEAGEALLPSARRVLLEIDLCRQRLAGLRGRVGGRLRIATSHHVGLHHLPPALRVFSNRFPEVELELHFMDSEIACRAVEQGELELAVVTLPEHPASPLLTQVIWPDPLDLVVAVDHPLARIESLDLATLIAYPAILPAPGTFTRAILERELQHHGLSPRVALESNYLETIKMMVSVGLGWSSLPSAMLGEDLVAIGRELLDLHRDLGIVRHRQLTLSRAAELFLELLQG